MTTKICTAGTYKEDETREEDRITREKRRQEKSERMKQWWADKRQEPKKGSKNVA